MTSHEGIAWKEKQLAEMEFSEAEMEILNDMYSEYERDDEEPHHQHHDQQQHQPIDMSISIVDEGGISGLEGLYKDPLPPEALWKDGTTLIIGDSMLGGIEERRLRNTKVRAHPGATIEDLHYHITPYLRKKPTNIICHIGTNNARSDPSDVIVEKLTKLKEYILSKCPTTKIIFSSLIRRLDNVDAARVVNETNAKLQPLGTAILRNDNITNDHISRKGLHLNQRGTIRLAMNLIDVLKELND